MTKQTVGNTSVIVFLGILLCLLLTALIIILFSYSFSKYFKSLGDGYELIMPLSVFFCYLLLFAMSAKKVARRNCAMPGCINSWYYIEQWMKKTCIIHNTHFGTGCCICEPPFRLIPFPTERKDPDARLKWTKIVNRKVAGGNWLPNQDSRICSVHFIDGEPTQLHPYPSLNLGYIPDNTLKPRPPPKEREPYVPAKKIKQEFLPSADTCSLDHVYSKPADSSPSEIEKDILINELQRELKSVKLENMSLKIQINKNKNKSFKSLCTVSNVLKSDKKVKFYTGIPTLQSFNDIFTVLQNKIRNMKHWKGPKRLCNPLSYKRIVSKSRKLTMKAEFILTMMKLRLGLLLEDLADRFGISSSLASNIFTTWVKVLSQTLGALVFNPPKEVVRSNLPPTFQNPKFNEVRHIIDCSEIFLERPSDLNVAAKTWSDYKHHHTGKFLVSINPSGMINFISECWGGRVSDKVITNQSGFLDVVEPYDTVLADRGFPIREELTLKRARLLIPPGRNGVNQMTKSDVILTKQIANKRIYIEQAIRRMKFFRILKYEVPISLMHHLDDIIRSIAGVCNLYPPLPSYTKQ